MLRLRDGLRRQPAGCGASPQARRRRSGRSKRRPPSLSIVCRGGSAQEDRSDAQRRRSRGTERRRPRQQTRSRMGAHDDSVNAPQRAVHRQVHLESIEVDARARTQESTPRDTAGARVANLTESLAKMGWSDAVASRLRDEETQLARLKAERSAAARAEGSPPPIPHPTAIAGYLKNLFAIL